MGLEQVLRLGGIRDFLRIEAGAFTPKPQTLRTGLIR
jgi:hypothetical protein